MDKDTVGKALGKVASGLYVIASGKDNEATAFTGSFLVQVSFEPPLIALSVNKKSSGREVINSTGYFSVNIMRDEQMKTVGFFARPKAEGEDKFGDYSYSTKTLGVPVLDDSLAYLECRVYTVHDTGDHELIIGEVVNGELLSEGKPATHVRKNGFNY